MKFILSKKIILSSLIIFSAAMVAAQTAEENLLPPENIEIDTGIPDSEEIILENAPVAEITTENETETVTSKKSFLDIFAFCVGFTPSLYLNTQGTTKSAPSPIFYPVYLGIAFPHDAWLSLQPSLKFFTTYYLITDGVPAPAEIENRTALAYSFLVDIPVLFRIDFFDKVDFRASAGISFLLRFATLASGVDASAAGYYGTAANDLEYINHWFFSKLRFIYLSGGASFMFNYGRLKFGPEVSLYAPVSILTDFSFDAIIFSAGVKLIF